MKKAFFVLIGVMVVFLSCKTTETTQQSQNLQMLEGEKPVVFKEDLRKNISVSDSLFFYNSTRIEIEGTYGEKKRTIIKDHKEYVIDNSITIRRPIEKMTAGVLVGSIKREADGSIGELTVSFSKTDTTFLLTFFREDILSKERTPENDKEYIHNKGSFILSADAQIYFKGEYLLVKAQEVNPVVTVISKKTGKPEEKKEPCRLLYFRIETDQQSEDVKPAEGWRSSSVIQPENIEEADENEDEQ